MILAFSENKNICILAAWEESLCIDNATTGNSYTTFETYTWDF